MQRHAKIYLNKVKKIYFIKNELKKILLKSIIQNKGTKSIIRSYCMYKLTCIKKKSSISLQKNVCLILSKHRSVYTKFNVKRHTLKKLNTLGRIPNITSLG